MRRIMVVMLAGVLVACGDDESTNPDPTQPDIDVTPMSLALFAQPGESVTRTLWVKNAGTDTLRVSSITDGEIWLSESPTTLHVSAGDSQSVAVTATASGMTAGTSTGAIAIRSNDPDEPIVTVSVVLNGPDTIPPPPPRDLRVSQQDLGLYLDWDMPQEDGQPVPDLKGYLIRRTPELGDGDDPYVFVLESAYLDRSVAVGDTYTYALTALDDSLNESTAVTSDPIVYDPTLPDIDVTPESVELSTYVGWSTTGTLTVRNLGAVALSVSAITDDQTWLSASPTSFSVNAGSSGDVTVTANAAGLSARTYSGTITIASNDPDEATKTVGVTFTVTGGGSTEIEMIRIQGGTFQMGSTSQWAYDNEQPVHSVTVSSFWMAKYEVTQAEYEEVMGMNPSWFSGDNRPVEGVSWYDAAMFCNALSQSEGRTPCYNESDWSCNLSANGYRLPTEAEWEYACRAGSNTDYYNGNETQDECSPIDPNLNAIGWYCGNSNYQTHEVGGKQANSFGLYDTSGNVYEWCNDWYGDYSSEAQTDPTGPSTGSYRVLRGGCWSIYAEYCRSAGRLNYPPSYSNYDLGFRPARR